MRIQRKPPRPVPAVDVKPPVAAGPAEGPERVEHGRSNALLGKSASEATAPQREVFGQSVVSAAAGGKTVTGEVLGHWVDVRGHARAQLRFTGVSVKNVVEMFTKEDLRSFFPTARSFGRHATADGGQAMLENPMPGPPIMYTVISPDEHGIHSTFVGLVHGGSKVNVSDDGHGGVLLDEDTAVTPALSDIPGEKLLESVPLFGTFQRLGREVLEYAGGVALAGLHQALVPRLAIHAMVATLARRAAEG
jgi:hypothetical protein